jgi:hypothetical protein
MAVTVIDAETTAGERVHRHTHTRYETHQPGKKSFLVQGLNVERQRMLRCWARRGSKADDLAHPNQPLVVVEREE